MLTPAEALSLVLERVAPLGGTEERSIHEALGRVLARDVRADIDLPPFPKSAMDGFAVRRADFAGASAGAGVRLRVLGESSAGRPFEGRIRAGECVAIYTGAVLPGDCDAVVMVEKSERQGEHVFLRDEPGDRQHVCERGEDLREGELVLEAGRRLSPADLSVLAAVGCEPVPLFRRPRVAIQTTGDELVEPSRRPGPGEIREGNTRCVAALSTLAGAEVVRRECLPDERDALERGFRAALDACDVLVTTGGVSMGEYDLVGAALERCGVELAFHKVAIKPGKPIWFGLRGAQPVFGLPGNPVSALVGHEVFVKPALAKLGGVAQGAWIEPLRLGRWCSEATRENPRQQNVPVAVELGADGVDRLSEVDWRSSGDIVGVSRAQGLAVIEPGEVAREGELVRYRRLAGASAAFA